MKLLEEGRVKKWKALEVCSVNFFPSKHLLLASPGDGIQHKPDSFCSESPITNILMSRYGERTYFLRQFPFWLRTGKKRRERYKHTKRKPYLQLFCAAHSLHADARRRWHLRCQGWLTVRSQPNFQKKGWNLPRGASGPQSHCRPTATSAPAASLSLGRAPHRADYPNAGVGQRRDSHPRLVQLPPSPRPQRLH